MTELLTAVAVPIVMDQTLARVATLTPPMAMSAAGPFVAAHRALSNVRSSKTRRHLVGNLEESIYCILYNDMKYKHTR